MENCKVSKPACMGADVKFVWVSDPPPTEEEMQRWDCYQKGVLCECETDHPSKCKCVTSIDRKKEPRLMAMIDANAKYFEVSGPFTDAAVPLVALFKCVATCELASKTEKVNEAVREARRLFSGGMQDLLAMMDELCNDDNDDDEEE